LNNRIAVIAALPAIMEEIEDVNAKWHVNPDGTPKPRDEEFETRCVLLMKSELMEAFEGIRKDNQPDSHLPQYPTESVEMIDLFIRSLDFIVFSDNEHITNSVYMSIADLSPNIFEYNAESKIIVYGVIDSVLTKIYDEPEWIVAIPNMIIDYCDKFDIPLMEIYRAKMDYNKNRADHKLDARNAVGGKKF